ncbi:hypothetical protein [Mucilaginibacter ginsenosidivorax]|uniref:hypothetical protein n=1 Tax=Mucilaginibacter ginsenosidivorax TaxID=862126 RepID=UPI0013156411|nr:hypothetical protein [Mucilaginibacter ginsenosidivorax]
MLVKVWAGKATAKQDANPDEILLTTHFECCVETRNVSYEVSNFPVILRYEGSIS